MKKIVLIVCIGWSLQIFAQKPDRIESIARVWKEVNYYETQLLLWEKEIEKNNQNQEAWINSYLAARAISSIARWEQDTTKAKIYKEKKAEIILNAKVKICYSYGYNLIQGNELGLFKNEKELLLAEELNTEDDDRIYRELLIYYETKGNQAKKEYYAKKMYEANELPDGIINWAYNLLSELEPNAIIFTAGDIDTYALWITQIVKNHRSDVTIMNYSMFQIDEYRTMRLKDKVKFDLKLKVSEAKTDEEFTLFMNQALKQTFNATVSTYISTTAFSYFEKDYSNEMYLTGLTYKYSKSPIDNTKLIVNNYESIYLKDHLNESFSHHLMHEQEMEFRCLYLPSLMKLYTHYKTIGNLGKMDELRPLIEEISVSCQQEEQAASCLNIVDSSQKFVPEILNAKHLEKSFLRVKSTIFMQEAEITNQEYDMYLTYLQENKMSNALKIAMYDSTQWEKKFTYTFKDPMTNLYGWHPAYANYPLVNVSFEGAKAYCDWLTIQYNQQKKRNYAKVVFRLPTQIEWKEMATAGDVSKINPFNGTGIINKKGCYLGNIKTSPTNFFEDGGFHTVRVESYYSNSLGFYNSLGNVAEMTNEKGIAIGGSWYHLYEECTFDKTQSYDGPDPRIGFRVVMEVIEF